MKTLLVLRHAKSSHDDPSLADHDRPLAGRGRRDAPRMGELLLDEGLVPDLILTSTARRAMKTARLAAEAAGFEGELRRLDALYLASTGEHLAMARRYGDPHHRVMLVGHNPGIGTVVAHLTGWSGHFPTAALAHIELPIETWADLDRSTRGKLLDLWLPREL